MIEEGYWNGNPASIRKVTVVLGETPHPSYALQARIGERVAAVEVRPHVTKRTGNRLLGRREEVPGDDVFYLFDEDGSGYFKVTEGRGSPGHRSISVYPVVGSIMENR